MEQRKTENCFANSQTYEYRIPKSISEEMVQAIGEGGRLELFPQFRRPSYVIDFHDGTQIKGRLGDRQFKVSYPNERWMTLKACYEDMLERKLEREGSDE